MTNSETTQSLRIVIAGTGRLGLGVMRPLLESQHEVVGILQNGRRVNRFNRIVMPLQARLMPSLPSPMQEATSRGVPVLWLRNIDEKELNTLRDLEPDLLITCGFSIILPSSVLDLPKIGCINVHTAMLPLHRGANPCAHVVLNGDTESGVTVHVTEKGIDTGAILAQEIFSIDPSDTSMDVYLASASVTEDVIVDAIDEIAKTGFSHGVQQNLDAGSYDKRFEAEDAEIDWTESAIKIDRLVRAAVAYSPAWFTHKKQRIMVARTVFDSSERGGDPGTLIAYEPHVKVATGEGSITLLSTYSDRFGGTQWPNAFSRLKPGMPLG